MTAPVSFAEELHRASMALVSTDSDTAVQRILQDDTPLLLAKLAADRAAGSFAHWGLSTVIDENLHAPVVGRTLFETLHSLAGLSAEWPVGNAGVLHLYGYLLSSITTPYGLKRERWVTDELSSAVGRSSSFVSSSGGSGWLQEVTGALVPILQNPETLEGRARARCVVDEFAPDEREEVFRAVYVAGIAGSSAVVYGVLLGGRLRLITAFPVAATTEGWLASVTAEPPRLRYNAVAHELPPRSPLAPNREIRRL
ncbi:amino acid deaminase [Subtercola sp. PAMC28395]|uniref:amino acid deaminase n=1 Tax=Subtercola sp. PAMC28395 TaxID=2846775 RepID=UPI001C0BBBA2|nr:amino acid deaminase [Subtercola sp. PAMC28395]QWT22764.1 amino acid deaminase [Subtercola sp. PAMC28395]